MFGAIALPLALRTIAVALVATPLVVTLLAVRRLRVKPWLKVLVLAIMSALGLAVLAIELPVHLTTVQDRLRGLSSDHWRRRIPGD